MIKGPCQSKLIEYPITYFSGKPRKFNPEWYNEFGIWNGTMNLGFGRSIVLAKLWSFAYVVIFSMANIMIIEGGMNRMMHLSMMGFEIGKRRT